MGISINQLKRWLTMFNMLVSDLVMYVFVACNVQHFTDWLNAVFLKKIWKYEINKNMKEKNTNAALQKIFLEFMFSLLYFSWCSFSRFLPQLGQITRGQELPCFLLLFSSNRLERQTLRCSQIHLWELYVISLLTQNRTV